MTLGINCTELVVLAPADRARVLNDIAAFGFKDVRFEVPFALQPSATQPADWSAVVDARDKAKALGLTLLPVLGVHMPTWAWTPTDFGNFCGAAATVLGAPAYEIGNEPNLQAFNPLGKATTYAPLLSVAYDGIKRAWPTATVISAGLAAAVDASGFNWFFWLGPFGPWANTSPETFLKALISLLPNKFDAVAYHPYSIGPGFDQQPPTPTQVMIARIKTLATLTPKTIRLTEWGFDFSKVTPSQAAQWFNTQQPLMNASSGPNRGYLYAWRDYGASQFGLVDSNNQPRQPFYDTVRAALNA